MKKIIERIKYNAEATEGNIKSARDCGLYNVRVADAVKINKA